LAARLRRVNGVGLAVSQHPNSGSSHAPAGTLDVSVPADSPTGGGGGLSSHAPGTTTAAGAHRPGEAHRPGKPWVIGTAIVATVVVGLLAVSVLYYQWFRTEQRDALIIVWGADDGAWDGATATVAPLSTSGGPTLSKRLSGDENLLVRFHVPPGHYLVRVTAANGRVLGERKTHPQRPMQSKMIWWPFRAPPAATQLGFQ
jgi:hypothetical protein